MQESKPRRRVAAAGEDWWISAQATGGSAMMALGVLRQAGVRDERVVFANVVSCPEGLRRLAQEAPDVRIVTCAVDAGLNDQKFIVPGLGDFGDRYFGTFGYDEGLWGCD